MGWESTWEDILNGGPTRWKVDDLTPKRQALNHILMSHHRHASAASSTNEAASYNNEAASVSTSTTTTTPHIGTATTISILCPLAGDDPFVVHAWKEGHSVTSIDMVPDAVAAMRRQFSSMTGRDLEHGTDDVEQEEDNWELIVTQSQHPEQEHQSITKIWKHKSGRATLYEGDMLERRIELENQFDAVYDKDSFGALDPDMRAAFCERVAHYIKDCGIVYTEVKFKSSDQRDVGPPFHLEKPDLMKEEYFGRNFDYVSSLGELYEISMAGMQQHGHILRRNVRY